MENAFVYLAQYNRAARRAGVSEADRNKVIEKAKSGDYDHLVGVIAGALADLETENV